MALLVGLPKVEERSKKTNQQTFLQPGFLPKNTNYAQSFYERLGIA